MFAVVLFFVCYDSSRGVFKLMNFQYKLGRIIPAQRFTKADELRYRSKNTPKINFCPNLAYIIKGQHGCDMVY